MKYSIAAALFVATVSAVPQNDIAGLLASIPACAQSCATSQISVVGQCSSDSAGLVHCLCLNKSFQQTFADCAKQSCTGANASGQCDLYTNSVKLCSGAGVDTSAIPKPDAAACPNIGGGSTGGSSSSAESSPAPTSAPESSPSASPSESAPAAATTSEAAPAATSASTGTAPPTNSSGSTTSPPPASYSSSASSLLVSGSFALFAGVAALLVL